MFVNFYHFGCSGNRALADSMRLLSAFAIEDELEDSRRKELERSEDGKRCTCECCLSERQK
jgi:hypothetical protein